jgi:hypothetical protein
MTGAGETAQVVSVTPARPAPGGGAGLAMGGRASAREYVGPPGQFAAGLTPP